MSKLSLIFQIIKESIFKPKLMLELAEEKSEVKDDERFRKHEYAFDFECINDFFHQKYPGEDITKFEQEIKEIDTHVENFFRRLSDKNIHQKRCHILLIIQLVQIQENFYISYVELQNQRM